MLLAACYWVPGVRVCRFLFSGVPERMIVGGNKSSGWRWRSEDEETIPSLLVLYFGDDGDSVICRDNGARCVELRIHFSVFVLLLPVPIVTRINLSLLFWAVGGSV